MSNFKDMMLIKVTEVIHEIVQKGLLEPDPLKPDIHDAVTQGVKDIARC